MEFPFDEEWKRIIGYEDFYKISNFGRVYNIQSKDFCKLHDKNGRNIVNFVSNEYNSFKTKYNNYVDLLVAFHFLPLPYSLNNVTITHLDDNTKNDKVDNLSWEPKRLKLNNGDIINIYIKIDNDYYYVKSMTLADIVSELGTNTNTIANCIQKDIPLNKRNSKSYKFRLQ